MSLSLRQFLVPSLLLHFFILFISFFLKEYYPSLIRSSQTLLSPEKSTSSKKRQPVIKTILIPLQGPHPSFQNQDSSPNPMANNEKPSLTTPSAKETPLPQKAITVPANVPQTAATQKTPLSSITKKNTPFTRASTEEGIEEKPVPQQEKNQSSTSPITGKALLSITSSFLKSLKSQGSTIMERQGEHTMPTFEELKYLSYQQQIDQHLMASWKTLSPSALLRAHQYKAHATCFDFEINEDGSLALLFLVKSSGDSEFDRFVLDGVRKASPFPPIPKHLGLKRYKPIGGNYYIPR